MELPLYWQRTVTCCLKKRAALRGFRCVPSAPQRCRAFTFIEIMAVVTIICVVAAFLFPGLTKAKRRAVATKIMSDNRQTNMLYLIEADPNDDYFPFADGGTTLKRGKNPGAAAGTNIQ